MRRTALLLLAAASANAQVVDITVIDVGQGDSILVEFPEARNGTRTRMLVDGGRSTSDNNTVVQFLTDRDIESLDIVAVTHPHDDHFAGLTPVLQQFEVEEVWWTGEERGPPRDDEVPAKWDAFAPEMLNADTVTQIDKGHVQTIQRARIEVLNAGGQYPDSSAGKDINNDSLVLMLSYRGVKVLLTGDIETDAGDDLVAEYCPNAVNSCQKLNVDILKIPHHGSHHFSDDFVRFTDPEVVLISAGHRNRQHHHPRADAIDAYVEQGATTLLSTSTEGDNHIHVRIGPDRDEIEIVTPIEDFVYWRDMDDTTECDDEIHAGFCPEIFVVE